MLGVAGKEVGTSKSAQVGSPRCRHQLRRLALRKLASRLALLAHVVDCQAQQRRVVASCSWGEEVGEREEGLHDGGGRTLQP